MPRNPLSYFIIAIDSRGDYVAPLRLRIDRHIASGDLEIASDLALTELHRDVSHELERRGKGR